jgi:hypothetical protein
MTAKLNLTGLFNETVSATKRLCSVEKGDEMIMVKMWKVVDIVNFKVQTCCHSTCPDCTVARCLDNQ